MGAAVEVVGVVVQVDQYDILNIWLHFILNNQIMSQRPGCL